MVMLTRIYTRTGDDGTTALGDGTRLPKDDLRVEAYGAVDELHAALGVLLAATPGVPESGLLQGVCNDLFDLGADLCVPPKADEAPGQNLRMLPAHVATLEQAIDRLNADLPALRSFVLRGGTLPAAHAHWACTVCRRAERRLVTLMSVAEVNPHALVYLNRLSDLLFVLARSLNGPDREILWKPGQGVAGETP